MWLGAIPGAIGLSTVPSVTLTLFTTSAIKSSHAIQIHEQAVVTLTRLSVSWTVIIRFFAFNQVINHGSSLINTIVTTDRIWLKYWY